MFDVQGGSTQNVKSNISIMATFFLISGVVFKISHRNMLYNYDSDKKVGYFFIYSASRAAVIRVPNYCKICYFFPIFVNVDNLLLH